MNNFELGSENSKQEDLLGEKREENTAKVREYFLELQELAETDSVKAKTVVSREVPRYHIIEPGIIDERNKVIEGFASNDYSLAYEYLEREVRLLEEWVAHQEKVKEDGKFAVDPDLESEKQHLERVKSLKEGLILE